MAFATSRLYVCALLTVVGKSIEFARKYGTFNFNGINQRVLCCGLLYHHVRELDYNAMRTPDLANVIFRRTNHAQVCIWHMPL
nr:unnamed protein product [Fasciola hepatica]CAK6928808.1 unnamed protein product [Fasciola hepatica]